MSESLKSPAAANITSMLNKLDKWYLGGSSRLSRGWVTDLNCLLLLKTTCYFKNLHEIFSFNPTLNRFDSFSVMQLQRNNQIKLVDSNSNLIRDKLVLAAWWARTVKGHLFKTGTLGWVLISAVQWFYTQPDIVWRTYICGTTFSSKNKCKKYFEKMLKWINYWWIFDKNVISKNRGC